MDNSNTEQVFEPQVGCAICGANEELENNFCNSCREKLIKRKIPLVVKLGMALVAIIIVISVIRLPQSVYEVTVFNRGLNAYKANDFKTAELDFARLSRKFQNSSEIRGWLAISCFKSGDINRAISELDKIPDDAEVSSELNNQFDLLYSKLKGEDK